MMIMIMIDDGDDDYDDVDWAWLDRGRRELEKQGARLLHTRLNIPRRERCGLQAYVVSVIVCSPVISEHSTIPHDDDGQSINLPLGASVSGGHLCQGPKDRARHELQCAMHGRRR